MSPIHLDELCATIEPDRTVLFIGAGAAVPSGAPTGDSLARSLCDALGRGRIESDELAEAAGLLEQRVGRRDVVEHVRSVLAPLRPTGGLLTLPEFEWHAIYSTNFDRLLELAYQRAKRALSVIRSNYDWSKAEEEDGTRLYKIHGCVSQDEVDGFRGRLVLTERDYEDYSEYRETLFAALQHDLLTKDALIIGHSLRDRHLRDQMIHAAKLKEERGAPGRILGLSYSRDVERAELLEQRGIRIAFGGVDEFCHSLMRARPSGTLTAAAPQDPTERLLVKPILRTAAIDVDQALNQPADATRLYNGRAATYADIQSGLTFRRAIHDQIAQSLREDRVRYIHITGVAGVGKTSLARQVLRDQCAQGAYGWEHVHDYPLSVADWLYVDDQLQERGDAGYLLVDDCAPHLRQVNQLAQQLSGRSAIGLRLVLTATTQQWRPRLKDSTIFSQGRGYVLSRLSAIEIDDLVRMATAVPAIRALVDPGFAALHPQDQRKRLRDRARADMFVCLKNIFGAEQLDTILLQEYAELRDEQQDVYRLVSALEAIGGRVHRQLILRLVDIRADQVSSLLDGLEGIVDESTISEPLGLYGWQTRHEVIAATIARYKYSDQDELYGLIAQVIEALNPAIQVELRSMRDMCNSEFGISTLVDDERQLELYEMLIRAAPSERIPRHRVIRKHLEAGNVEATAQAIRQAEEVVGLDRPINRFKVRLAVYRAEFTKGILPEDRVAMLRHAESTALHGIERFSDDRLTYGAYADVGVALARLTGDLSMLDEALRAMTDVAERMLDPAFGEDLLRFEKLRQRLHADSKKAAANPAAARSTD
jgi:hypothetical protein